MEKRELFQKSVESDQSLTEAKRDLDLYQIKIDSLNAVVTKRQSYTPTSNDNQSKIKKLHSQIEKLESQRDEMRSKMGEVSQENITL